MRQRKYQDNTRAYERIIDSVVHNALMAHWNDIHEVQELVFVSYQHKPHLVKRRKSKPVLGFEATTGNTCLDGSTLLINPFKYDWREVYALMGQYYYHIYE